MNDDLWATHGQTAAEKIYYSADANKPYKGMLSFKGERPKQADSHVCHRCRTSAATGWPRSKRHRNAEEILRAEIRKISSIEV